MVIIGALISSGVANAFTHTANMPLRHPVALATCSTGVAAARRATKTTLRMVASPDKGGGMVVEGPFEGKVCDYSNRRMPSLRLPAALESPRLSRPVRRVSASLAPVIDDTGACLRCSHQPHTPSPNSLSYHAAGSVCVCVCVQLQCTSGSAKVCQRVWGVPLFFV